MRLHLFHHEQFFSFSHRLESTDTAMKTTLMP
jgi:hypothetical protein